MLNSNSILKVKVRCLRSIHDCFGYLVKEDLLALPGTRWVRLIMGFWKDIFLSLFFKELQNTDFFGNFLCSFENSARELNTLAIQIFVRHGKSSDWQQQTILLLNTEFANSNGLINDDMVIINIGIGN